MSKMIPPGSVHNRLAVALLLAALLSVLLMPTAAVAQTSPPRLHLGPGGVTVSGVAPGAAVAWVAVGRLPQQRYQRVLLFEEVVVADGEGVASLEADWFDFSALGVPVRSVWAAVEIATGRLAVAAPPAYGDREVAFPADGLVPGRTGGSDGVRAAGRVSRLLLVRPGEGEAAGAWFLAAGDGTPADADRRADGRVQVALDALAPLGATLAPAPSELADGDVLISLDPERMTAAVAVLETGRPAQRGGAR